MKSFEIAFDDLNEKAQKRLMNLVGIKHPKDMNWDIPGFPLAIVDFEDAPEDSSVFASDIPKK